MAEDEFASEFSSDDGASGPPTRYYLRLRSHAQRAYIEDSSDEEESEEERVSTFRSNPLLMLLRNLAGSVGASGRQSR